MPLPEGFVLDEPINKVSTLPKGFVLDKFNLPEGFQLDWESVAKTNPDIQKWWKELPDRKENTDVVTFMKNAPDYNYQKAIEKGLFPTYQPEHKQYRWISDNPELWKNQQPTPIKDFTKDWWTVMNQPWTKTLFNNTYGEKADKVLEEIKGGNLDNVATFGKMLKNYALPKIISETVELSPMAVDQLAAFSWVLSIPGVSGVMNAKWGKGYWEEAKKLSEIAYSKVGKFALSKMKGLSPESQVALGGMEARDTINKTGGEYVGIQKDIPNMENQVLFNEPTSKSTTGLPISQVTPESVKAKLTEVKTRFEEPINIEPIIEQKIPSVGFAPKNVKLSKGEAIRQIGTEKYSPEVKIGMEKILNEHPEMVKRQTISHEEIQNMANRLEETPIVKKLLSMPEGQLAAESLKLRQGEDALIRSTLQSDLGELGNNIRNILQTRQTSAVVKTGTELGRALEQQKMMVQSQQEIANLINQKIAQIKKDPFFRGKTGNQLVAGLMELRGKTLDKEFDPSFFDKAYEFWLHNILSGVLTHETNITSNVSFALAKPVEKGASAAWDIPLSWFTGKREHYFSEIPQQVKGAVTAFNPKEKLPTGITIGSKYPSRAHAISGKLGEVVRLPSTALSAEDNFAKRVIGFMELNGRADTIARQEGLKGAELIARKNELLATIPENLKEQVTKEQLYRTFQDSTGMGELLSKIPQKFFRWIMPFRNVLSSIITKSVERTPLGFVKVGAKAINLKSAYSQYELATDLGNATLGTALATGIGYAYLKGKITGATPMNKAERDLFYAQGKQPYSVLVDGKYLPYGKLEPYGTAAMQVVDTIQGYKESDKDLPYQKAIDSAFNITKSLSNKSFLSGMTMFVNALSQPERYAESEVTRTVGGFIPASSLLRNISRMTDLTIRERDGLINSIMADIPVLSKKVPAKLNVLGQEISREPIGVTRFSPYPITKEKNNYVVDELVRLKAPISYPSQKIQKTVEHLGSYVYKLEDKDYRKFLSESGQMQYTIFFNLFSDPRYQMLPDEDKVNIITQIINTTRESPKQLLTIENLEKFKKVK